MIEDLDKELEKSNAEAIIITGQTTDGNPSLKYVTQAQIPRGGDYFKKVGEEPILIVGDLDTANAIQGIVKNVFPTSKYNYSQLLKDHEKDAQAVLYSKILKELDVTRIVLCGMIEAGHAIDLARRLEQKNYEVLADSEFLDRVRRTKSSNEIKMIANIAERTESVVRKTLEMLQDSPISGNTLLNNKKSPLTVKEVKSFINKSLAEVNLVASLDTIFAPGSDGADPHNHGTPTQEIKTGVPIVFDIFPKDVQTGYCFDTTRTFVIGQASPLVKRYYEDVLISQQSALEQIRAGADCKMISQSVCEILEKKNHKTYLYYTNHPGMEMTEGFIHGLGHGVGLTIGELPYLSLLRENNQLLEGDVVTVEPGVYYPGKFGIRIEDTVTVKKSGLYNFSTLSKELEI